MAIALLPASLLAQARVISLTGALSVKHSNQALQQLRINDTVGPGDELNTGENSQAIIQTSDGSTVQIFPDSRVIFSEPSFDLRRFLHLILGSIRVHIETLTGRPNPHSLTTPTAVIAVRGTVFSVFVDEDNATLVAVDEGVVGVANVASPGDEVLLQRGQRTWVRRGLRPLPAQAFRGPSERADTVPAAEPSRGRAVGRALAKGQGNVSPPGLAKRRSGPTR